MTTIGPVTLSGVQDGGYASDGYTLVMRGWQDTEDLYNQLRELFALASVSTFLMTDIPGRRPVPVDHSDELNNTHYCTFSDSALENASEAKDGWYLLKAFRRALPGVTTVWYYDIEMFFIGTEAEYQVALRMRDLSQVTNDWSI